MPGLSLAARAFWLASVFWTAAAYADSLGDAESRQAYRTALLAFFQAHAADLSDDSKARLQTNPLRILDSKDRGDRAILENAPRLDEYLNDSSKRHFAAVTSALDSAGIDWTFDPLLVRGLDYYCHTAFEFITEALGAQGTVLGGGRYDGLSEMLGGPQVAGVGWAAGVERLAMLVGDQLPETPQVAIMPMDEEGEADAHRLAEMLRDNGFAVDLAAGGAIGKRMKKADRAGVRMAVILGSDELAAGTAQLRDLATGTQSSIAQADLAAALASALAGNENGITLMSLDQTMDRVLARRGEVEARLSEAGGMSPDELATLSRELSELRPVCEQIELVRGLEADRDAAAQMIEESDGDAEIMEMARGEIEEVEARLPDEMKALQLLLLPRDRDDSRNAILEVRAGAGGDEAALFASDLFGMYQRFAARHGWRFEVMEISETGIGGYKEATANIAGTDVFARLKFESGVHRVQRVPETEAGGRIHTSAATVAVLPEAEDVDIDVQESDLRIDVFRASGPGGQSVPTTDSAVRSRISRLGSSSVSRMRNRSTRTAPRR